MAFSYKAISLFYFNHYNSIICKTDNFPKGFRYIEFTIIIYIKYNNETYNSPLKFTFSVYRVNNFTVYPCYLFKLFKSMFDEYVLKCFNDIPLIIVYSIILSFFNNMLYLKLTDSTVKSRTIEKLYFFWSSNHVKRTYYWVTRH